MTTLIHKRVQLCRDSAYEKCIAKMPSGWAVMGDVQFLQGYCLLLPDPVVPDLNAMNMEQRQVFLTDMTRLGDAVLAVTGAVRINYEILRTYDMIFRSMKHVQYYGWYNSNSR